MAPHQPGALAGFGAMAGKEVREIVHTWRLYVVPGVLAFFALTGPVLARFMRVLLESALGTAAPVVDDPTALDSWAQWAKNLQQLGLIVLVVSMGGIVSGERRAGTALLVLTKPVGAAAFAAAKFCGAVLLVVASTGVGTALTWAVTAAILPDAHPGPLLRATGVWLVLAVMVVALMVAASAAFESAAAASGVGLGVVIVASVGSLWGPAARWSPAGLPGQMTSLAAGGPVDHLLWPILTAVAVTVVALVAATMAVRRMPL